MSDQHARDAALDTGRSILLQAPAGSGKTTVLAQRFLAALAEADQPEQVLAITFTRKAAAEMRDRVLQALESDADPARPDAATWRRLRSRALAQAARRGWRSDELSQRLRIQTIDSLAHEIARAMPLLGRMQSSLQVIDDASELHAEAARETLRHAEGSAEYREDADRLLQRLDNNWDQAARLLGGLLPSRNRWQPVLLASEPEQLAREVSASLARIVGEVLQQLATAMPAGLREEAAGLARASAGHRADAGQPPAAPWSAWLEASAGLGTDPQHLGCWQAVAELVLKDDGEPRKTVDVRHGFPPKERALKQRWGDWKSAIGESAQMLDALRHVALLPPPALDEADSQALAALARIMMLAAMHLKLVFRERGLVDHAEIAAIARQALGDENLPVHPALRVSHLLVDEFQDTSPEQLDLVHALIAADAPGESERSLFLVGDPMQSIYMFRDSEVGLFLQTRARGLPPLMLDALHLGRNFRSQPPLVQWANKAFASIFPATEDMRSSAVTFLPAEAARAPDERIEPAVHVWPQSDDPAVEAAAIAGRIRVLRDAQPGLSIAVLVQTRALAGPVLRALREATIPVIGVDLAALSDRAGVRDLVALGRALLDAGDRGAWLAMLRSPPCGLLLPDLLQLCELAGQDPLVQVLESGDAVQRLSADGAARLARVAPVLCRAWRARGSLDVASLIEQTWHALGGDSVPGEAAERQAGRHYLLELRRLQEQFGRLAPERLSMLAARLRDHGEAQGESPVEVLTIHHAKGLEWDVVFVPGLGKPPRADQPPLLRWLQLPAPASGMDLLLAVRSLGEGSGADPLSRYIARLQARRQMNERLRLLYVAVTRARLQLFLSGHAPVARDGRARPPGGSLLGLLWPVVAPAFDHIEAEPDGPVAEPPAHLRMNFTRLPSNYQLPAGVPLPDVLSLQRALSERDSAEPVEFSWVGPLARAAGTVLHAELERLAELGEPAVAGIAERAGVCAARLREQGIDAAQAEASARAIVQRLGVLVGEEHGRWLLFAPHREARSELRLSGIVAGELRNVAIDRSFVDDSGTRWVIDYKTGVHAGGGLEEFIEREMQRYASQLRLYAELAGRLEGGRVRTALYFPWLGVLRESGGQG